jgi:uncharacterized protein
MNYFDTSALVKRFVEEPGSGRVEALIASQPQIATSKIAYAELHAALARKLRERKLTLIAYRRISGRFELDWHAYIRVELADALLGLTRELVRRHPLRGFDAIHLAAAIRLQDQLNETIQFIAADQRLLHAAQREGLTGIDVRK